MKRMELHLIRPSTGSTMTWVAPWPSGIPDPWARYHYVLNLIRLSGLGDDGWELYAYNAIEEAPTP